MSLSPSPSPSPSLSRSLALSLSLSPNAFRCVCVFVCLSVCLKCHERVKSQNHFWIFLVVPSFFQRRPGPTQPRHAPRSWSKANPWGSERPESIRAKVRPVVALKFLQWQGGPASTGTVGWQWVLYPREKRVNLSKYTEAWPTGSRLRCLSLQIVLS